MGPSLHRHVGFTGTQIGVTPAQESALRAVLERLRTHGFNILHHGDCIGADKAAHDLAGALGYYRVLHPPTDTRKRAFCLADETLPDRPYLDRNHDIVDVSEVLIACPKGPEELRSGTWATVRYARKNNKRILLVWADGTVTRDHPAQV